MLRARLVFALSIALCSLMLSACPDGAPTWQTVAADLPEALLSVHGTSATDVWAVGADQGHGPLILHFDGTSWRRIETTHRGHLWWVQALSTTDVFAGGANGAILRWNGTTFERMDTPGLGRQTVFGIWGSSPTNVYAVGGFSGRSGFIWRYDGTSWRELVLPANCPIENGDVPGLFKVWGDGSGAIYAVGGAGMVLMSDDGETFQLLPSGTTDRLFTVSGGRGAPVTVVGGLSNGRVLEISPTLTFSDHTPALSPLVQGVAFGTDGAGYAVGANATVFRREGSEWREVTTGIDLDVESLHATWIDPTGGVWAVGGNVLSPALDNGAILHAGATSIGLYGAPRVDGSVEMPDAGPAPVVCPADAIDTNPEGTIARRWNEQILNAIRRDIPRPGVHARNLYHVSAAMWDAWAAYDTTGDGVFVRERHTATDLDTARREAISYAAYRVLHHRYAPGRATNAPISQACFDAFMGVLGYDPTDMTSEGDSPRAIGNRIGLAIVAMHADDGANEQNNYADTTGWMAVNTPTIVDSPMIALTDPDKWQQLNLFEAATQNGIVLPAGVQGYIGAQWGEVRPFALTTRGANGLYLDPGEPPRFLSPEMHDWAEEMIVKEAELEVTADTIDISPGAYGNNALGANDGAGHPTNPTTGQPYAANVVPRGDFGRVLAEYWADGPRSETPPGHWNSIVNYVRDHPAHALRLAGSTTELDPLEWDVKVYLAVNGAVHDAAIVAWGVKRAFSALRPMSTIRYMASLGQSSNESLPNYHAQGLRLVDGVVEVITAESSAPGQRHQHLAAFVGQVAVRAWPGEPGDRLNDTTPIQWIRGVDWVPYQRRNFVTPAFPGFVSGHSTFSRAAAEVLAGLDGDPYFPGGLGEFEATAHQYLVFEDGPSVNVTLQWATYYDAADQAGQSRVYGGIHIAPDDFEGRRLGSQVGMTALTRARAYWDGTAVP